MGNAQIEVTLISKVFPYLGINASSSTEVIVQILFVFIAVLGIVVIIIYNMLNIILFNVAMISGICFNVAIISGICFNVAIILAKQVLMQRNSCCCSLVEM